MADDIVTRLWQAIRQCDHGWPNGGSDFFPAPTECGSCQRQRAAADEIAALRHWKAEATRVIEDWQAVFDALIDTDSLSAADLGRSKSVIVAREIVRLRCDNGELRTRIEEFEARRD